MKKSELTKLIKEEIKNITKIKKEPIQGGINWIFPNGEVIWIAPGDEMSRRDFRYKENWDLYNKEIIKESLSESQESQKLKKYAENISFGVNKIKQMLKDKGYV